MSPFSGKWRLETASLADEKQREAQFMMSTLFQTPLVRIGVMLAFTVQFLAAMPDTAYAVHHSCEPARVGEELLKGNLPGALAISEQCAAHYRSKGGNEWSDLVMFAYHKCSVAQIYAMKGEFQWAENTVAEADALSPQMTSPLVITGWLDILLATKGFVAERRGDIQQAKYWYNTRLSYRSAGRLAILAFSEGKYDLASKLADSALKMYSNDPTAYAVLGALAESAGGVEHARKIYEQSLALMAQAPKNHDFLPLTFAESSKIQEALKRLAKTPSLKKEMQ